MTLPEGDVLNMTTGGLAVSPDGRRLAYVASRNGVKQLFVRDRESIGTTPIEGTESATLPFFSPDGEWLGFFREQALWKVALAGGAPLRLCETRVPGGASWGPDGTIVMANFDDSLVTVRDDGGVPSPLETGRVRFPIFLPDGEHVVFVDASSDPNAIVARSLSTDERRVLVDGSDPRVHGDYLVFVRESSLWAAPFDLASAAITGASVPVMDNVNVVVHREAGSYDVASDGSLTFVPGTTDGRLVIVEPGGESVGIGTITGYHSIRLSPDGRKVAGDGITGIGVHDLDKGTRLSIAPGTTYNAVWSPDGAHLAFDSRNVKVRAADGTGDVRTLLDSDLFDIPTSWSSDDGWIAAERSDTGLTNSDIWMHNLSGESRAFIETPATENGAAFSPDGEWVAYQSDQSARFEVYVEPFPGPGERVAVSARGGTPPVWSPDGSELYFRQDTAVMAATVESTDSFAFSSPRRVIDGQYWLDPTGHVAFGVFPDGKLLMIDTGQANEIHVVLNWVEELKRLVSTNE